MYLPLKILFELFVLVLVLLLLYLHFVLIHILVFYNILNLGKPQNILMNLYYFSRNFHLISKCFLLIIFHQHIHDAAADAALILGLFCGHVHMEYPVGARADHFPGRT